MANWKNKFCERCDKEFKPTSGRSRFCSIACRWGGERICEGCGQTFIPKFEDRIRFCSRGCYKRNGIEHQNYRAPGGYLLKYVGRDYPGARPDGRILVHRYVMQELLGRELTREESVHHKNGNKEDNRPENLELWTGTGKQPRGIRVSDEKHCPTCTCGD